MVVLKSFEIIITSFVSTNNMGESDQNGNEQYSVALSSAITSLPSINTPLTTTQIKSLHPVKLFTLSNSNAGSGVSTPSSTSLFVPYTSIEHTPQGNYFITTSPDGSLQLYDALRARSYKTIYSKKYGCANAMFTLRTATQSTPSSCVISSTISVSKDNISNNSLRFLDLNTNSFIRYFQGHTKQITSIVSSPSSTFGLDSFYSSSMDGTVRVWDSRLEKCFACLAGMGYNPVISIERSGTIMAIWNSSKSTIFLVPVSSFPTGIIGEIKIESTSNTHRFEKMVWADKGLIIMDAPGYDKIVVDTFKMKVVGILTGVTPFIISNDSDDVTRNGSTDVSPDGLWCISGSGDGSILAWDLSTLFNSPTFQKLTPVRIRDENLIDKKLVPRILAVNPKFGCIVTADTEIVMSIYDIK